MKKTSFLKLLSSLCREGKYDLAIKLFEIVQSLEDRPFKKMYRKLITSIFVLEM